jgi:K+/H+ antiporter YhaU regulatory subunit KhtT
VQGSGWAPPLESYQGREVVACLATQLVLVPEPEDVLHIGDQVLRVGLEDNVDEEGHEGVGGRVGF